MSPRKFFFRVRRRLGAWLLPLARRSPFWASVYYGLLSSRFGREHMAVLAGRRRFSEFHGPGAGTSTRLRRSVHRLEKGLIMRPRRAVYALDYIEDTVNDYRLAVQVNPDAPSEEVCWARDVLQAYFDACSGHELIDRLRKDFAEIEAPAAGCLPSRAEFYRPYQRNLEEPAAVSYDDLLQLSVRRRSVRWFLPRPVPRELIEKAVVIAGLSPSACNRQPFEFRFFDDPELLSRVACLPGGTTGFHDNFPVVGVVLGSLAHYYDERDRHVIYVDGGLAAMSLQYALETLGLSSCCINWPDLEDAEVQAAETLGLKSYERPVMFLAIGYPDPDGLVPYSEKKSVAQLCRWNHIG